MALSFPEAVGKVSSLQNRGWRLGLDRMQELVRRLEIEHWPKFVHIAGTNGKGSVTAFAQSILQEQGWRTGAYFSPFVYSVRERIQFLAKEQDAAPGRKPNSKKGALISPLDFAALVESIWPIGEELEHTEFGGPTEFEFKTAMGFRHWSNKQADFVPLEVGLGGRLDATNVIDPACSVITSIGLDHVQILGNTHAQIAMEKAGIIKPGRPVVVGEVPAEAWHAIDTLAKVNQSPVWRFGRDFVLSTGFDGYRVSTPGGSYERLTPGITGSKQPHNMAVAIAAVEAGGGVVDVRRVSHGVAKAYAPGRMEWVEWNGLTLLLDGAHNAEAVQSLVETLESRPEGFGKIVLLTGMLEGHNAGDFYEPLAKLIDQVHFAPIDFWRSRTPEALFSEAGWLFERASVHSSVHDALKSCAESDPDLILVTGSFYLVGEVGRILGMG